MHTKHVHFSHDSLQYLVSITSFSPARNRFKCSGPTKLQMSTASELGLFSHKAQCSQRFIDNLPTITEQFDPLTELDSQSLCICWRRSSNRTYQMCNVKKIQQKYNSRIALYNQSTKMKFITSQQLFHKHGSDSHSLESLKSIFSRTSFFHRLIRVTADIAVATSVSVDIILIWLHNYRMRSVSHCGQSGISVRKLISTWTGGEENAKPSHKIFENEVKGTTHKPASKYNPNTHVLHSRYSPKFTHNEWKGITAG